MSSLSRIKVAATEPPKTPFNMFTVGSDADAYNKARDAYKARHGGDGFNEFGANPWGETIRTNNQNTMNKGLSDGAMYGIGGAGVGAAVGGLFGHPWLGAILGGVGTGLYGLYSGVNKGNAEGLEALKKLK